MTTAKNNRDEDDEDVGGFPRVSGFVNQKLAHAHHFYLSGPIKEAQEYMATFEFIRNAGENDLIVLHINSEGGSLFTTIQFMRVINETKATVIASVEGACMSAATVIFLCSHSYEISNHSMFMLHNYSGMAIGKGNEMHDQLAFERVWSKSFFEDVYKDFLTSKEIEEMLNGRDLWMTGEEVGERLKKRQEVRQNVKQVAEDITKTATQKQVQKLKTPVKKAAKKAAKKAR